MTGVYGGLAVRLGQLLVVVSVIAARRTTKVGVLVRVRLSCYATNSWTRRTRRRARDRNRWHGKRIRHVGRNDLRRVRGMGRDRRRWIHGRLITVHRFALALVTVFRSCHVYTFKQLAMICTSALLISSDWSELVSSKVAAPTDTVRQLAALQFSFVNVVSDQHWDGIVIWVNYIAELKVPGRDKAADAAAFENPSWNATLAEYCTFIRRAGVATPPVDNAPFTWLLHDVAPDPASARQITGTGPDSIAA